LDEAAARGAGGVAASGGAELASSFFSPPPLSLSSGVAEATTRERRDDRGEGEGRAATTLPRAIRAAAELEETGAATAAPGRDAAAREDMACCIVVWLTERERGSELTVEREGHTELALLLEQERVVFSSA